MPSSVLIIGLGNIGMRYDMYLDPARFIYSHARAFSVHPDFELTGGVDLNADFRNDFEQIYQKRAYSNIAEAIQAHVPDIVVIAVPTVLHGDCFREVLDHANPKLVLIEKPVSSDLDESCYIVTECSKRGIQLFVNYFRIADRGVIEIKSRIEDGRLGTFFYQ